MKTADVADRWGIPFADVAASLAAQGLSAKDSALAIGMSHGGFCIAAKASGVTFDCSHRRTQISRERKREFWSLLREIQATGANRKEAALQLGYNVDRFRKMLSDNPDKDPFPDSSVTVASQYLRDSGQTIGAASREMAARGMTASAAARMIGYATVDGLLFALKARGITIQFAPRSARSDAKCSGVLVGPGIKRAPRSW